MGKGNFEGRDTGPVPKGGPKNKGKDKPTIGRIVKKSAAAQKKKRESLKAKRKARAKKK